MANLEIWKNVPMYENYSVSNLGNVKNTKRLLNKRNANQYLTVVLYKNAIPRTFGIHQLVAMAFLGHLPNESNLVVNHKDFNKHNNTLCNLEIVTTRKNTNRLHLKSTSEYTGVCKSNKNWASNIQYKGKTLYLGVFKIEKEASEFYEKALLDILENNEITIKRRNQFKIVRL